MARLFFVFFLLESVIFLFSMCTLVYTQIYCNWINNHLANVAIICQQQTTIKTCVQATPFCLSFGPKIAGAAHTWDHYLSLVSRLPAWLPSKHFASFSCTLFLVKFHRFHFSCGLKQWRQLLSVKGKSIKEKLLKGIFRVD